VQLTWSKFHTLTVDQLYTILALRFEVFVREQRCFYLDPDGKDKIALHLLGEKDNRLCTYLRLFLPTDTEPYLNFGRVVTARSMRHQGYGRRLMEELLRYCQAHYPGVLIICSAQAYLQKFYEEYGFQADGELYEEAGIAHIAMRKKG